MKVANDKDYDDYNDYADHLAYWLQDKLANDLENVVSVPQALLYRWVQEFNKEFP